MRPDRRRHCLWRAPRTGTYERLVQGGLVEFEPDVKQGMPVNWVLMLVRAPWQVLPTTDVVREHGAGEYPDDPRVAVGCRDVSPHHKLQRKGYTNVKDDSLWGRLHGECETPYPWN